MKFLRSLIFTSVFATGLLVPGVLRASEDTYVCGQSYGQPVVCGVKVPEEEALVVKAGLKEDLRVIGLIMVAGSLVLFIKSKRAKTPSLEYSPVEL